MFSEKGVDATTIEDITERADVGKGTFYRHFDNKNAVMAVLADEAVAHLVGGIRAGGGQPASLEGVLERVVDAHLAFFNRHFDEFVLMFQGRLLLKLDRVDAVDLEQPYLRYLEAIEEQLGPWVPQGLGPGKVRQLACAVAGFVSGFFSFAVIGLAADEIEKSIEPLRQTFVTALSSFLRR